MHQGVGAKGKGTMEMRLKAERRDGQEGTTLPPRKDWAPLPS